MTRTQERLVEVFLEHFSSLYRRARYMVGNDHEAEDVMQEVSISIFQSKLAPGDAAAWLRQVTYNKAVNVIRKQKGTHSVSFVDPTGLDATYGNEGDWLSIECNEESARILKDELARLPINLRVPTILLYYEELTHAEIGMQLGIGEEASRNRVHRARILLRARLSERLGVNN